MAQNITLLGASYSDVPSVELPKTGGGTASFTDVTDTTAAAADVAAGKYFFTAAGVLTVGTASGGGSGGLEYETGTWTPASDTASYIISFTKTHTTAPWCYAISDAKGEYSSVQNSAFGVFYTNFHQVFGEPWNISTSVNRYGVSNLTYRATNSSGVSASTQAITSPYTDSTSSSSSYPRYWATETGINAYVGANSRYWRAGRTYKWIAIWAPTS